MAAVYLAVVAWLFGSWPTDCDPTVGTGAGRLALVTAVAVAFGAGVQAVNRRIFSLLAEGPRRRGALTAALALLVLVGGAVGVAQLLMGRR